MLLKVLKNSQKCTCAAVSFFNKIAGSRPSTLLKKGFRHSCFPFNFVKLFRASFLQTQTYEGMKHFQFSEAAVCKCSLKGMFLEFFKIHRNIFCARGYLFDVGLRSETLFKKWLQNKYFPVNFSKCLRTPLNYCF